VQAGIRYDHARYTPRDTTSFVTAGGERIPVRPRGFGSISGSVGALWAITPVLRLGTSISRAYRTPDFNELYSNGPHLAANAFEVGDPALGQETGAGLDVFARLAAQQVRGEVAVFANVLSGYIFPSSRGRAELGSQGGRPRFQYTNEDARFNGAEAELSVSLTDLLHVEAGGSLVRARFNSERAPIPVFDGADTTFVPASRYPPLIPPARARFGLRAERPGWFGGFGIRAVARQDRLGDFESVTDGYALLELTAGLRIARAGTFHTVTLRVDNALDTEYRDHLSRVKDIIPGAGRGLSLIYRLVF
jgi:iron complex outermembrane receptor protein